jgi:uncharacterized membrane protein
MLNPEPGRESRSAVSSEVIIAIVAVVAIIVVFRIVYRIREGRKRDTHERDDPDQGDDAGGEEP